MRDLLHNPYSSCAQIPTYEPMPFPSYLENNIGTIVGSMLPGFLWISFAIILVPLARRIVQEKSTGVKELMKMMGLPNWMHWVTWFINALSTATVTLVIIVLLLCIAWKDGSKVLDYSNWFVLFVFLFLYTAAIVTFSFAQTTLFDSRK